MRSGARTTWPCTRFRTLIGGATVPVFFIWIPAKRQQPARPPRASQERHHWARLQAPKRLLPGTTPWKPQRPAGIASHVSKPRCMCCPGGYGKGSRTDNGDLRLGFTQAGRRCPSYALRPVRHTGGERNGQLEESNRNQPGTGPSETRNKTASGIPRGEASVADCGDTDGNLFLPARVRTATGGRRL